MRCAVAVVVVAVGVVAGCDASSPAEPDAPPPCMVPEGIYRLVPDLDAAVGDCPTFVVEELSSWRGGFDSRECGPVRMEGGWVMDCDDVSSCSATQVIETLADADGLGAGTLTLTSTCADAQCTQREPLCFHQIPVAFVRD